jgi:hypothetical protein
MRLALIWIKQTRYRHCISWRIKFQHNSPNDQIARAGWRKNHEKSKRGIARPYPAALPACVLSDLIARVRQIAQAPAPALIRANPANSAREVLLRCAIDRWHGPCKGITLTSGR